MQDYCSLTGSISDSTLKQWLNKLSLTCTLTKYDSRIELYNTPVKTWFFVRLNNTHPLIPPPHTHTQRGRKEGILHATLTMVIHL